MTLTKKFLIISSFLPLLLLTACGAPKTATPEPDKPAFQVGGQTVAQSKANIQEYEYPALVLSEQEAKIIAKTSGTVKQINYKLGETVRAGQLLARIDDVNQGGALGAGLSSNQIRQAQLAVEQAEINKRNLALTSAENLKGAQIAYESAKIAVEQARLSLLNRETSITQSYGDADINAETAADAAADTIGAIITGINNIAAFDPTGIADSPYKNNLGVTNSQLAINAKNIFDEAKKSQENYLTKNFTEVNAKLAETIKLIRQTNQLVAITKNYLDASLVGGQLTQTILSGFQTAVAGYQSQISAALAQVNGAKQALENNKINSDTSADALTKAYELAQQQENNALQALKTQQANTKATLDAADLQYRNALVSLQSIIDVHLAVSPISGKVTQNFAVVGDTVTAGQQLATVSSGQTVKFQFYVDETILRKISAGQTVATRTNGNKNIPGKITSLAGQADSLTKRFLAEVTPENYDAADFSLGTVVDILIAVEEKSDDGAVILPLSAIEIGQNDSTVFTIDGGLAKKTPVEIVTITGEKAKVKIDLPETAVIITDGNKLIQEGDPVTLKP